jgi:hypothetical protein
MVAGTSGRIILHVVVPDNLVGLDTLLAPVISLAAFVCVSLLTQKSDPPRPEALTEIPTDQELVTG